MLLCLDKKKNTKLKQFKNVSSVDSHEKLEQGQHKKSSKRKRENEREYYSSESNSLSETLIVILILTHHLCMISVVQVMMDNTRGRNILDQANTSLKKEKGIASWRNNTGDMRGNEDGSSKGNWRMNLKQRMGIVTTIEIIGVMCSSGRSFHISLMVNNHPCLRREAPLLIYLTRELYQRNLLGK